MQYGIPYARWNMDDLSRTCPQCGERIEEFVDEDGDLNTTNYPDHFIDEHRGEVIFERQTQALTGHRVDMREARIRKGWTQKDLAKQVGCTNGRISQIEKGEHPSSDLARRIEEALGAGDMTTTKVMAGPGNWFALDEHVLMFQAQEKGQYTPPPHPTINPDGWGEVDWIDGATADDEALRRRLERIVDLLKSDIQTVPVWKDGFYWEYVMEGEWTEDDNEDTSFNLAAFSVTGLAYGEQANENATFEWTSPRGQHVTVIVVDTMANECGALGGTDEGTAV